MSLVIGEDVQWREVDTVIHGKINHYIEYSGSFTQGSFFENPDQEIWKLEHNDYEKDC